MGTRIGGGETRLINKGQLEERLKKCNSENSKFFLQLLEDETAIPWKTASRTAIKNAWDETNSTMPSPKKTLKFLDADKIGPNDLKRFLKHGLGEYASHYFFLDPTAKEDEGNVDKSDAAHTLVDNLDDPTFQGLGYIKDLLCLDLNIRAEKNNGLANNAMDVSDVRCTVFPQDYAMNLEHHSEAFTFSMVLEGEIVWLYWPPTPKNLEALQKGYEKLVTDSQYDMRKIVPNLEYPTICGQDKLHHICFPPFGLVMGIATKTTVLATYDVLRAENVVELLKHMALTDAWFKSAKNPVLRQAFGVDLPIEIERILQATFDTYKSEEFMNKKHIRGPLTNLVRIWDQVKDEVAKILEDTGATEMQKVWVDFLRKVGDTCAICDAQLDHEGNEADPHFRRYHWPPRNESKGGDGTDVSIPATTELGGRGAMIEGTALHSAPGRPARAGNPPSSFSVLAENRSAGLRGTQRTHAEVQRAPRQGAVPHPMNDDTSLMGADERMHLVTDPTLSPGAIVGGPMPPFGGQGRAQGESAAANVRTNTPRPGTSTMGAQASTSINLQNDQIPIDPRLGNLKAGELPGKRKE